MSGINLLPWRVERRKRKQQEFLGILATALALTVVTLFLVHLRIAAMIDYQGQRNQYLQSEIDLLNVKIKEIEDLEARKKRLISKMDVIQRLQSSRPEIVHLFDEVARTVPDGVQLLDLTQADNTLTINGIAQSNARVSAYMRNLESSLWLKEPVLNVIETKLDSRDKDKKDQRGSRFTLQVRQGGETPEKLGNSRS